jgi:hypothetical protein
MSPILRSKLSSAPDDSEFPEGANDLTPIGPDATPIVRTCWTLPGRIAVGKVLASSGIDLFCLFCPHSRVAGKIVPADHCEPQIDPSIQRRGPGAEPSARQLSETERM